jgi:hypothetical protein
MKKGLDHKYPSQNPQTILIFLIIQPLFKYRFQCVIKPTLIRTSFGFFFMHYLTAYLGQPGII